MGRLKSALRRVVPAPLWRFLQRCAYRLGKKRYWYGPAETTKSRPRRLREGFFEAYCQGSGLDIGHGGDPVVPGVRGWDLEDGDAQYLRGVPDESFDFVYSSHTLEHMADARVALENWWRVVKRGGYLILYVPDRDLYERRRTLPSRWNPDHKAFFLLDREDPPDTIALLPLAERALPHADIVCARRCDEGHAVVDSDSPSLGEYSIEVVLRKAARSN